MKHTRWWRLLYSGDEQRQQPPIGVGVGVGGTPLGQKGAHREHQRGAICRAGRDPYARPHDFAQHGVRRSGLPEGGCGQAGCADHPQGKNKSLPQRQRRWLKLSQAVEPAIGHLSSDTRRKPCWLQGSLGDAIHAVCGATGYQHPLDDEREAAPGQEGSFVCPFHVAVPADPGAKRP